MTEMEKLIDLLKTYRIPHEVTENLNTPQVWYPSYHNSICDVICHRYSYGGQQGLLEIMGLVDEREVGDTVEGWLTATQVFGRIHADYFGTIEEGK